MPPTPRSLGKGALWGYRHGTSSSMSVVELVSRRRSPTSCEPASGGGCQAPDKGCQAPGAPNWQLLLESLHNMIKLARRGASLRVAIASPHRTSGDQQHPIFPALRSSNGADNHITVGRLRGCSCDIFGHSLRGSKVRAVPPQGSKIGLPRAIWVRPTLEAGDGPFRNELVLLDGMPERPRPQSRGGQGGVWQLRMVCH
jgi:hypothetical protein